jgi:hypothetical protein
METLRAAVEVVLPAGDGFPSGLEVGAERHIRDAFESVLPGATDLLAGLLDAYAADAGAAGFTSLDADARAGVLRTMLADPSADVREMAESILLFGYGALVSEWSGYDRATKTLKRPAMWDTLGFGGPVEGYPEYRDA